MEEKRIIAAAVEKALLDLKHPEMPESYPKFTLHVDGAAPWSWADITPNWTFGNNNKPGGARWNEIARSVMEPKHSPDCCAGGPPSPMVLSTPENACCDMEADRMRRRKK